MFSSIVMPEDLQASLGLPGWLVVDCRFSLADPDAGARQYAAGHIPGAVYVHLERDLSGPPATDHGRHPLPAPDAMRGLFSRLGVHAGTQVVAYDDVCGAMAARLWWMLRYMGHAAAAVLDGGWQAWQAAGGRSETRTATPVPAAFVGTPATDRLVRLPEVPSIAARGALVDAREPARFRGEVEPIDPVAGHIPGAVNRYWQLNLQDGARLLPPDALAASWIGTLGRAPDATTTHYCGSGVTACHNVLAQVRAGFPLPRLYVGSWSEWCRDAARPVACGGAG